MYKHVFSQCCSFLQSHPAIITPRDKVKKHTEWQLLKMLFIVVVPRTLSHKMRRICLEGKHWELRKTHYKCTGQKLEGAHVIVL